MHPPRSIPSPPIHLAALALLVLIAAGLLAAALPATGRAAPTQVAGTSAIDADELAQVRMINRYRRVRGLAPLRIDGVLTRAAQWQVLDMGRKHRFDHVDSLGRDPFQRLRAFGYPSNDTWRGENLAAGNEAPYPTWVQWRDSPPHRANWLRPRFRAIGVARVFVPGSPYGWYWATSFGSRWTTPALGA